MPFAPGRGGSGPEFGGSGPGSNSGGSPGSGGGAGFGSGNSAPVVTPGSAATAGISTGIYGIFQDASGRVMRGPGVMVDPKAIVTVQAESSTGAANTQNCFVAVGPGDLAKNGPRITLTPTANPRTVRVRNLNEIQVFSTVTGEGVTVDIQPGY